MSSDLSPVAVESPARRWPVWLVSAVAIAAIAIAVGFILRYHAAAEQRDDVQRTLSETEADLTASETNLTESEADLADTEADLTASEANLTKIEADLADAQAHLARSEAELTDSDALLAESEARVADYRTTTTDFLALSIGTAGVVTQDDATCMAEALLESLGPDALGLLTTDSDAASEFGFEAMRVASGCGVELDSFAPLDGSTYGDNPEMDALYDGCAGGDGASCDSLYQRSGVRTDYETFGLTCGNRFERADAPPFCEGNI